MESEREGRDRGQMKKKIDRAGESSSELRLSELEAESARQIQRDRHTETEILRVIKEIRKRQADNSSKVNVGEGRHREG